MRRDLVIAIVAVIAVVVISLVTARKPEPPKYATHESADFSFGGYRAWYDMLQREGVRLERFRSHHDHLGAEGIDTLVMSFESGTFAYTWNASERAALRSWIRGGGRLIDIGYTPSTGAKDEGKDEAVLGTEKHTKPGALRGPWSGVVAALEPRDTVRLIAQKRHRVETLLADRAGLLVVRYAMGRGDVIAVATGAPFENRTFGQRDAARLAYLIAQPKRPGGIVAFDEAIHGDIIERAWYDALTVPQRVALGFAALAGVAWLIYGLFPLGPPVRTRAPREPTSAEFVDAVAALYGRARAREHARDALIAGARRGLESVPRTPANLDLAARIDEAAHIAVADNATLVAVAALARTAREETIRAGRHAPDDSRRTFTRGLGPRRRRR